VWEGDDWPVLDGFGALIARHAQGIPAELETPATRISWGGRQGVTVETPRGTLEARAAIIAVSTGVLASERIRFAPALPDWKQQAIDDLPLGSCNKVALAFTRNPFGDLDTVMLMPDLGPGPSVEFVVREGGRNVVTTMFNGPHAKALAADGARAMADYALTQLAAIFGNDVKACVTDRLVFADWDHPRRIVEYVSDDLEHWTVVGEVPLDSDRVIDACVARCPDGRWRLYVSAATPGTKHWRVELVEAATPEGLAAAAPRTVLAGDDTIIVVCSEHAGGASVAADLATLAGL